MNFIQRKLFQWLGGTLGQINAQRIGNGVVTWSGQNKQLQVKDGYMGNDAVYSIINLITSKAKVAEWHEYEIKDKKAFTKYKALVAQPDKVEDWNEVVGLQQKAMQIVEKPTKISELLKYPNDNDTWADLIEALICFKLVTGDSYTYGKLIEAGNNKGFPNSLHPLPSQYMSIIASINTLPSEVVGYQLQINEITPFDKRDIMHDKFVNLNWDGVGSELYGLSPLHAGSKLLTKSNESKRYEVSILQNGGLQGIMYVQGGHNLNVQEITAQVDLIRNRLRNYTGSENAGKVPISGIPIGYTPIGINPKDAGFVETYWNDIRAFCNLYGVPSQLQNDPENKTFNSLVEAEKALTVRATLPHLNTLRDNFNRKFATDWGGVKDRFIDFDLNCYPELQKNKKELMEWISKAPISIERTLELLGEPIPEWMDEETRRTILTPSNMTALGELPIDIADNPYGK